MPRGCGQLRNLFELNGSDQNDTFVINEVVYDTRTLSQGGGKLFFALTGKFRSGAAFIENAYQKGVRAFVVEKTPDTAHSDAVYLQVNDFT